MTVTAAAADLLAGPTTRRDGRGKYRVLTPDGGKLVSYTRATTIAKALDDTSNLMNWGKRMTALGLAKRPDLVALVATTDADDRKALDDLCERASEAGGATARRDIGTAMHTMVEKSHADPTWVVPEAYAADVAAINVALDQAGYDVLTEYSEQVVVLDEHQIAGTFDLLLRHRDTGRLHIGDLKTGASVKYGGLGWAIQLAIYAHANARYTFGAAEDGSEDRRLEMPEVDKAEAVIVHCQPGSGHADLHLLDIAKGHEALHLALDVRAMRTAGRKVLTAIATLAAPSRRDDEEVIEPASTERRQWVHDRIAAVLGQDTAAASTLAGLWPEGVKTLKEHDGHTDAELDAIAAALVETEKRHQLGFFPPDPTAPSPVRDITPVAEPTPAAPVIDEGEILPPAERDKLIDRRGNLDPPAQQSLDRWAVEGHESDCGFSPRRLCSERRVAIVSAAITLAAWDPDDEAARVALGVVLGQEIQPAFTVGSVLGSLTLDEAKRLGTVARALALGEQTVTFDASGTPTLAA